MFLFRIIWSLFMLWSLLFLLNFLFVSSVFPFVFFSLFSLSNLWVKWDYFRILFFFVRIHCASDFFPNFSYPIEIVHLINFFTNQEKTDEKTKDFNVTKKNASVCVVQLILVLHLNIDIHFDYGTYVLSFGFHPFLISNQKHLFRLIFTRTRTSY